MTTLRHFGHLSEQSRARLFAHPPQPFSREAPATELGVALGATLYLPATRPHLADDLARRAGEGLVSAVVCLEDAIADSEVDRAQAHAVEQLRSLAHRRGATRPVVFVRVRRPEQVGEIVRALRDEVGVLSGFVLPKFTPSSGATYFEALRDAGEEAGVTLLAMPVIESPEVLHRETRTEVLLGVAALLDRHRAQVPAVRLGATDLCAVLGVRRPRELTIYDVGPVADVIHDVVNVLGRTDGTGFPVTGPVWEYFADRDRLFKPQLRETPFARHDAPLLRRELLRTDLDGFIREIVLDRANGLIGKTVVHPSHVPAVNALSVVSAEEHQDALDVVRSHEQGGGARASGYANKMNEAKPHRAWAERTLRRASLFGVARDDVGLVELLSEAGHS